MIHDSLIGPSSLSAAGVNRLLAFRLAFAYDWATWVVQNHIRAETLSRGNPLSSRAWQDPTDAAARYRRRRTSCTRLLLMALSSSLAEPSPLMGVL